MYRYSHTDEPLIWLVLCPSQQLVSFTLTPPHCLYLQIVSVKSFSLVLPGENKELLRHLKIWVFAQLGMWNQKIGYCSCLSRKNIWWIELDCKVSVSSSPNSEWELHWRSSNIFSVMSKKEKMFKTYWQTKVLNVCFEIYCCGREPCQASLADGAFPVNVAWVNFPTPLSATCALNS